MSMAIYCDMCKKIIDTNKCVMGVDIRKTERHQEKPTKHLDLCPDCYQTICECINDNRKVVENE